MSNNDNKNNNQDYPVEQYADEFKKELLDIRKSAHNYINSYISYMFDLSQVNLILEKKWNKLFFGSIVFIIFVLPTNFELIVKVISKILYKSWYVAVCVYNYMSMIRENSYSYFL